MAKARPRVSNKEDTSKYVASARKKSVRGTLYLYGVIAILVAGIFFSIPKLRFWETTEEINFGPRRSAPASPGFVPQRVNRPSIPEGVPKLTIEVVDPQGEQKFDVADDSSLRLSREAAALRGRATPQDPRAGSRGVQLPRRSVMDLAAAIRKSVFGLYRFDLGDMKLLAVRESAEESRTILFTHVKASTEQKDGNAELFDTSNLTPEEVVSAEAAAAKILTSRKHRLLNFCMAYLLSFLSSIGHVFTAPNGEDIIAISLAHGALKVDPKNQILFIMNESEEVVTNALKEYDTEAKLPPQESQLARSLAPVQEQQDQLVPLADGLGMKYVWPVVSTVNGEEESTFYIDLGCMQFGKIEKGLEPVVTDASILRNINDYEVSKVNMPEESIINKGTKYFFALKESKPDLLDDVLKQEELNAFAAIADSIVREFDPDWIKMLESQQKPRN
jgi:hypothetical protein